MNLIKSEHNKYTYDNGAEILIFYANAIYYHDRIRITYNRIHRKFQYLTIKDEGFHTLAAAMMKDLPDFTRMKEEQLFQQSLLYYDIDELREIQQLLKDTK